MDGHGRIRLGYVVAVLFLLVAVVTSDVLSLALAGAIAVVTMAMQWYVERQAVPVEDDLGGVLSAWARGWALARRFRLTEVPGGVRVEVGEPERTFEYIVSDAPDVLASTIDTVRSTPGAWISVVTQDPSAIRVWLADGGLEVSTGSTAAEHAEALMHVDLAEQAHRELPDGYRAEVAHAGGVVTVTVTAADGEQAASGRMSVFRGDAVADRIETDPAHRRRGLGGAVMATLVAAARDQGATRGLLVATEAGEPLYEALGWTTLARLSVAKAPGDRSRSPT